VPGFITEIFTLEQKVLAAGIPIVYNNMRGVSRIQPVGEAIIEIFRRQT
jgi:hypothetical protein